MPKIFFSCPRCGRVYRADDDEFSKYHDLYIPCINKSCGKNFKPKKNNDLRNTSRKPFDYQLPHPLVRTMKDYDVPYQTLEKISLLELGLSAEAENKIFQDADLLHKVVTLAKEKMGSVIDEEKASKISKILWDSFWEASLMNINHDNETE